MSKNYTQLYLNSASMAGIVFKYLIQYIRK
jgi:hypothetical protein